MTLHGIYYGIRPLENGRYGILVKTYIKGEWIETDKNTTPWPTAAIAEDRAHRAAVCKAERENGVPVIRAYMKR